MSTGCTTERNNENDQGYTTYMSIGCTVQYGSNRLVSMV